AEAMFRETLAMRRKLLGNEHHEVADTLIVFGELLRRQHNYPEAELLIREALAIRRKLFGTNAANTSSPLYCLGQLRQAQGELEEAETLYREALAVRVKSPDHYYPAMSLLFGSLADVLQQRNKL